MPHAKKPRLVNAAAIPAVDINYVLGTDELALIFGYLIPEDIMRARVCRKMREAATITIVPVIDFEFDHMTGFYIFRIFCVNSVGKYNAMAAMTTVLPNLQQVSLGYLGRGRHKYSDGEDPDEDRAAQTAYWTTYDIDIISRFRKLRALEVRGIPAYKSGGPQSPLNGRYPSLFNFPLLQSLTIEECDYLKWDLEMVAGLPLLKELFCHTSRLLTGNINSLRVLKDTLAKVSICNCHRVDGNFMDLADFPHLRALDLTETSVTGDIREIGENDFPALEDLELPHNVHGGTGYAFQRISDVSGTVNTIYRLIKERSSTLFEGVYWKLSKESPDWYDWRDERFPEPPLEIQFAQAGPRLGWRWENESSYQSSDCCMPCEVNWLDPEPEKDSIEYERYVSELEYIQKQTVFYKGYYQPPTEDEYNRLCEGLDEE
jgi:hypothetical protein